MKTYSQSSEQGHASRKWLHVDAEGAVLGRLASEVASLLRGKHKPEFTPHVDGGDFVVVTNAAKIKLTGNKLADKIYYNYSGYIGGLKEKNAGDMLASHPERLIETAVKGMLPKGPLGRRLFSKLKIYPGSDHPHSAQNPVVYALGSRNKSKTA